MTLTIFMGTCEHVCMKAYVKTNMYVKAYTGVIVM